jgi:hypothetical protein
MGADRLPNVDGVNTHAVSAGRGSNLASYFCEISTGESTMGTATGS